MAKSKELQQWLPSGGVLIVAIGAGLVAAILVNVYINHVRTEYEAGAKNVLQMAEEVEVGTPLQARHLKVVMLPKPFVPAMKQAVDVKDKDSSVIGKKAPRHMYPGEFLFYPDFILNPMLEQVPDVPKGYSLVTIPISGEPGAQLQPGTFVTIYGEFNISGDSRRQDVQVLRVVDNVRVKLVGGSAEPVGEKNRSHNDISIIVRQTQAQQLLQIQRAMPSKRFTITLAHRPEGPESAEPEVDRQVLDLIEKGKVPALGPSAAPSPP
ncbi:MAG: hypothetical protein NTU94_06785 [Planctomycetota bacterium]|nr:hypothetical protein [Planctomycetota bacterium]